MGRGAGMAEIVLGVLLAVALAAAAFLAARYALLKRSLRQADRELGEIVGRTLTTDADITAAARTLQEKGARNVLVSMAGDGALLLDEKGEVHRIGTPKGKVVNSVGAGDSMVAGFVAGYLRSGSYLEALRLGTACGSATAFSLGLAKKEKIDALLATI